MSNKKVNSKILKDLIVEVLQEEGKKKKKKETFTPEHTTIYNGETGKIEAVHIANAVGKNYLVNERSPIFLLKINNNVILKNIIKILVDDNDVYRTTSGSEPFILDNVHDAPESYLKIVNRSSLKFKSGAPIFFPDHGVNHSKTKMQEFLQSIDDALSKGKVSQDPSDYTDIGDLLSKDPEANSEFKKDLSKIINLDDLKKLNEDEGKLEVADFEIFFDKFQQLKSQILSGDTDDKSSAEKLKLFQNKLISTYNAASNDELKAALASVLRSSKETDNVKATGGTSSGYRISSRSASGGAIDFQVLKAFEKAFPKADTFDSRVQSFNDYVNEIAKLAAGETSNTGDNPAEKISKFIMLDLLQQILYDFEASSAGWVFESFLAFIAFGTAIGAGYGAGDFTIKTDEGEMEGSAKLLQKASSSQNFENVKPGEAVRYVIGVKKAQVGDKFAAVSQGQRTGRLEIYILDFERTADGKNVQRKTVDGKDIGDLIRINKDFRIPIEPPPDLEPKVMNLLFLQANDFQDISGLVVDDISSDLKIAMEKMSSLKANIDEYVMNFDKPEERVIYSTSAIKDYSDIKNVLIPDSSKEIFGGNLEEQKITSNYLKKIIQETLKK